MIRFHKWQLAAVLGALLAACGGGGSDTSPRQAVSTVKVFGDSLADVGTFGLKFTVQGGCDTYPERVAESFGLAKGCNFYVFTGATFAANTTAVCDNFAIGGGVINPASSSLTTGDPRTIGVQLATAATVRGNYSAGDLLVIDGGGNDASALVGAYLAAATDGGASFVGLVGSMGVTVGAAGLPAAGVQYMTALADRFYEQIKSQALDKGAQRIVLLNMPGITNTPRFQMVLNGIGASAGATARAQSEALFKGWIEAFNAQLAAKVAGDSAVALVDFYTAFNDQVATPAQFGLSNVVNTACPAVGVGGDGLPTYSFPTCTAAALSAQTPPAGATGGADWWKTYAFSDGFHPTPYGHQLVAQLISRTLARAGWL